MNDVLLTIPGEGLATAKISRLGLEAELKKQLALQLYREGLVSGAGACRIAGLAKELRLIPAVAPLLEDLRTKARFWIKPELAEQVLRDVGEFPNAP